MTATPKATKAHYNALATARIRAARLARQRAEDAPQIGKPGMRAVRCQGCGAWVDAERAVRWTYTDPRDGSERVQTRWLCGVNCRWLFAW